MNRVDGVIDGVKFQLKYPKTRQSGDDTDIDIIVPFQAVDVAKMHVQARQLPMILTAMAAKKSGELALKSIKNIKTAYLISSEEVEHEFSFEGKDIRTLTFEEIQDVVVMFDLREVPLYKVGGLREQLNALYGIYSQKVLGKPIKYKEEYFTVADMPPIYVGKNSRVEREVKPVFKEEAVEAQTDSLEALKRIADSKGVKYHHRAGYDTILELINQFDSDQNI
jgi:hypothetical protein